LNELQAVNFYQTQGLIHGRQQIVPADPAGTVEVVNVEGSIEISGWDQPSVEVSGNIGDKVERVDVTSSANHTTVRVVLPSGNSWDGDSSAHLKIRVPQDLGVVGFDDTRVAQMTNPLLTTVHVPMSRMGATAIELLCERIAEPTRPVAKVG
jgi:hypothetical protein